MERARLRAVSACTGLVMLVVAMSGVARASDDPDVIMRDLYRSTLNERRSGRLKLTVVKDGGEKRERIMRVSSKGDGKTRKSIIQVESPADVRGTGFVSVEYPGTSQAAERWLFLPNLKRTSRVAGGQLSSSFLGSDLSFADLGQLDPNLFTFTMQKPAESVDGEECWVIGAKPKSAAIAREIGYTEAQLWISKSKLAVVRMRGAISESKRLKYFQASSFRKLGQVWMPDTLTVRTVEAGKLQSESTLQTLENRVDPGLSDDDFTKQRLEAGP